MYVFVYTTVMINYAFTSFYMYMYAGQIYDISYNYSFAILLLLLLLQPNHTYYLFITVFSIPLSKF